MVEYIGGCSNLELVRDEGGEECQAGGVSISDMVNVVFRPKGEVVKKDGGNIETDPFGWEEGAFCWGSGGEAP